MGYHDFAGDLPVHIIGGLAGLITTYMLGPRINRFAEKNEKSPLRRKL